MKRKEIKPLNIKLKKNLLPFLQKIRLIDYVFFLIAISLSIFLIFRFKRAPKSMYIELTFSRENQENLYLVPPEYWEVEGIKVGDNLINGLGDTIGVIEEIELTPWGGGSRMFWKILIKSRVMKSLRPGLLSFEGERIFVGSNLTLNLEKHQLEGQVVNIFENIEDRYRGYDLKTAIMKIKARGYEKWIGTAIDNFELYNSQGEIIIKVLSVETEPSRSLSTDFGQLSLLRPHPYLEDLDITLELNNVLCKNNYCYFDYYFPLTVGTEFWMNNGKAYVGPNTSIKSFEIIERK